MRRALIVLLLFSNLGCTAVLGRSRQRDLEFEEIKETLREIRTDLDWIRAMAIQNHCVQGDDADPSRWFSFDDLLPAGLECDCNHDLRPAGRKSN